MRRPVAMTAALGAAAFVLAAVPAGAAEQQPGGQPCGMATSEGDPGVQGGYVWGGPATVEGSAAPFAIRCSVQVGTPDPLAQDAASARSSFGSPAVLGPTAVRFGAPDGSRVFLCTEYLYVDGRIVREDADPRQPGDQCDEARHASVEGRDGYFLPDQLCVWYNGTTPRTGVCVPLVDDVWAIIDPR